MWIYTIQSSMELFGPVIVQHHGNLTLTLDFQGEILKMLYPRNGGGGGGDWHETEGMWVDRMLDPHCDFELLPHPWPWPLIFMVKFWKGCNSGMGCLIDMEWKGWESTESTHVMTFNFDLTYDLGLKFSTQILHCIPGTGGSIDMEWKGYESIGCYTYFVTLSYDLDFGFSRSN